MNNIENPEWENYLNQTPMLNYNHPAIQKLTSDKGWSQLSTDNKIGQIYSFVQNDILFGYNINDNRTASQILSEGIGQCNTKATLLMTLLRGVGVPCRFHAFYLDNKVQKGAIPPLLFPLAPKKIVHTWAEVLYEGKWYVLEGVILDKPYLQKVQEMVRKQDEASKIASLSYCGYGIGTEDVYHPSIDWKLDDTYIQNKGIMEDLGVYCSPDDFFKDHGQELSKCKSWIYEHFVCHMMTKRVCKIRNS